MMSAIVILLVLVLIVAVIDYRLARRLSDDIGSWTRER